MTETLTGCIRILVADEEPIFRRGLCSALESSERFQVVGLADSLDDARPTAAELQPDVVVADLRAERAHLDSLAGLKRECPRTHVLALGDTADAAAIQRIFQAGASGFVPRSAHADALCLAVAAVHRGETYLTPATMDLMRRYLTGAGGPIEALSPLTAREEEILRLIAEGLSNKEVASQLFISVRTVENHRASIMRKLHLRSVVDLVKYAISSGVVRLSAGWSPSGPPAVTGQAEGLKGRG
jgi:two-component system response regulator NreC